MADEPFAAPRWTWHEMQDGFARPAAPASHASGERGSQRTADDDWASTSRFSPVARTASPSGSNVSWVTESARARTPTATDSSWDQREYDDDSVADDQRHPPTRKEEEQARFRRRYKPRTCRICLETVEPTFVFDDAHDHDHDHDDHEEPVVADADVDGLGGVGAALAALGRRAVDKTLAVLPPMLHPASIAASLSSLTGQRQPRVMYLSEDPEDGRLISPCHCKGSQKYVHEGCVQRWRRAQPLAERNFWRCPTCHFEYRIGRLRWSRLVSHRVTRVLLTGFAFLLTLFVLGFVADPLIDLWSDPAGTIADTLADTLGDLGDMDLDDPPLVFGLGNIFGSGHGGDDGDALGSGWIEHFLKGFFSLGIVGVIKTFLAVSPFTWWNLRGAGLNRGRRRVVRGGNQRFDSVGWVFIVVGALTFLSAAWKGISYMSARLLEHASDRIADIGGGGPDVDEDEDDHPHHE